MYPLFGSGQTDLAPFVAPKGLARIERTIAPDLLSLLTLEALHTSPSDYI